MLIRYPHFHKMAKLDKQSFCPKTFFDMTLLHAQYTCIYIMYAKYQMASVKALVQVDFPVYALSEH